MQWLLIKETKFWTKCKLVEDYDEACNQARLHVGDHNAADGCSTPAHCEMRSGPHGQQFGAWRTSSFGPRRALVRPIGLDFEVEIPK